MGPQTPERSRKTRGTGSIGSALLCDTEINFDTCYLLLAACVCVSAFLLSRSLAKHGFGISFGVGGGGGLYKQLELSNS